MSENKVRLSKIMTERGICSRREADEYIKKGQVLVDGVAINELGTKIDPGAKVELNTQARSVQQKKATLLINKPVGYVSSTPEKDYKPAVSLITTSTRDRQCRVNKKFHRGLLSGLAPAGRLDIDSRGLIVFTQDGVLAKKLIGADSQVEKEYIVKVVGSINRDKISKLCHGLSLDGEALRPAKITQINDHSLKFILTQGKKRQIRRMCDLVGLNVTSLKRIRIGNIKLGTLREGHWRFLRPGEEF